MAKHLTINEIDLTGARLGNVLVYNGTKFIAGSSGGAADQVVATITARDALTQLIPGQGVLVIDATLDTTVTAGYAYYKYMGQTPPFLKVAEGESLDIKIEMLDNIYNYTLWNADLTGGASRHVLAQKFKEHDDLFELLAPARAAMLTGISLLTTTTRYGAKLPGGLPAAWYRGGASAGSTINTLIYTLPISFYYTGVRTGAKDKPATYGNFQAIVSATSSGVAFTNQSSALLSVAAGGAISIIADGKTTGTLTVSNVAEYNGFWEKADIAASFSAQVDPGYLSVKISHSEAGTSNISEVYWDNAPNALSFQATKSVSINLVPKYTSGILYAGHNTILNVAYGVNNLYNNAYRISSATRITNSAGGTVPVDPTGTVPPNVGDVFGVNKPYQLSVANVSTLTPTLSIYATRPNGYEISHPFNLLTEITTIKGINTYSDFATNMIEYFQDESYRRYAATPTLFDSTVLLPDGEAEVACGNLYHTYHTLIYPRSGAVRYDRRFIVPTPRASGTFTFVNFTTTNIATYNTGNYNLIIHLENQDFYFDLGKPFGQINGTGDGKTLTNSIGARVSVSGNQVSFSFGTTGNTSSNNSRFRLIIILRAPSCIMGAITLT